MERKNFFVFAADLRKDKHQAQVKGSRIIIKKEINRLKKFAAAYLSMDEIDVAFLRKYEAGERARGMEQNTLNTTFKWFRTVITHAVSESLIRTRIGQGRLAWFMTTFFA